MQIALKSLHNWLNYAKLYFVSFKLGDLGDTKRCTLNSHRTLNRDACFPTNQFMFTIFLTSVDLQLKPYRSDDYLPQLCYESSRFHALGQQWVVKANVVGNEKSLKRVLTYQLVQKGKVNLNVKFLMLRSPFSDLVIKPEVHQQEFSCDLQESSYHDLVLLDPTECNKMLEANTIKLRMILFQIPGSD